MQTLGIDLETFSSRDIVNCGSFKYIDSPDFEILLFAYSVNDAPATTVDLASGEGIPSEILRAVTDRTVTKISWNCAFERYALEKYLSITLPPEEWHDDMIQAARCGLPLNLAGACDALGLGEDKGKMREGHELIRFFCCPCKPTKANGGRTRNRPEDAPEKWETFKAYNKRDVDSETTIRKMLSGFTFPEAEQKFWCVDARINERGMKIDREIAENAVVMDAQYKTELTEKAVELTGIENPKSVVQIKSWLFDQEGQEIVSLNKKVIADVLANLKTEKAKEFLALRGELSKSSTAKYTKMLVAVEDDDHVRGCFQFYGANRTGRFAGRLLQLQNLPQNHMPDLAEARALVKAGDYETVRLLYDSVSSTLSELIRPTLIPEPGCRFIVSDFSAIEARVIAWLSGEEWVLDEFRGDGLIYEAIASKMFHVPKLEIRKGGIHEDLRPKGKIAQLALGYGGGINALKAFGAEKMGMAENEMVQTVDLYRQANPRVVALWRSLEKAAIRCVVHHRRTVSTIGQIPFDYESGILWMTLPSGRRIAYFGAKYEESRWQHGNRVLTYMGTDQKTHKWTRVETWGGKLAENLTQATARDCLREAMLHLDDQGYDIRAHVHDEVIISEPLDGRTVADVTTLMGEDLPWAPGLPLRADGYETPWYKKD